MNLGKLWNDEFEGYIACIVSSISILSKDNYYLKFYVLIVIIFSEILSVLWDKIYWPLFHSTHIFQLYNWHFLFCFLFLYKLISLEVTSESIIITKIPSLFRKFLGILWNVLHFKKKKSYGLRTHSIYLYFYDIYLYLRYTYMTYKYI